MIYITQGGRCGNQLFNYAFARKLQLAYPSEQLTFDFTGVIRKAKVNNQEQFWEDSLARFNVTSYNCILEEKNVVFENGTFSQKCLYLIWKIVNKIIKNQTNKFSNFIRTCLLGWLSKYGIYYIQFGYAPYKISKCQNKFLWGSFEDIRWFDDIKHILIEELTPKEELDPRNTTLYNSIITKNSVCVSLRRWSIDVRDKNNLNNREICGEDYYSQAINIIKNRIDNPVFVIFSDDVKWATNIIKRVSKESIVLAESGDDDVAEKLRLMSSCKHYIMSNSTFCWWAQYLCRNENKIVISPNRWLDCFGTNHPLIQNDWILIDTRKDCNE